MTQDEIYNIGIRLVNEVSSTVIGLAQTRDLGSEVGSVGAGGDKTKIADDAAETIVKGILGAYHQSDPDLKIVLIAEETGVTVFGPEKSEEGFFIILDPLDGSNNLRPWRTPSPLVSVSAAIGRLKKLKKADNFDAIEVGIVRDIFNHRTFVGKTGTGSEVLEYGEISVSPTTEVDKAIVGIDFDVQGEKFDFLYSELGSLLKRCRCQRRIGSSILDFMKVACGEYDAFVTLAGRMKLYDVAAAQLIIKEAGGRCRYHNPPLNKCLIKELIKTRDSSLLSSNTFKVVSAGTADLIDNIDSGVRVL